MTGARGGLVCERVSKRFRQHARPHHRVRQVFAPFAPPPAQDYWAVRDVGFPVPSGAAVAVIGANGSGKSTLLRMLAGTLRPTEGRIERFGRVAALLDPSVGFHPELTGRDNVYLRASLHGLRASEVRRRLDEIVTFSGLEAFVDRPLRTYSTGMAVRLGFATVTHLDFDVLVIDEVLASGDLAFQRRAAGRVRALKEAGCAVVVATHSLRDVGALCERMVWLEEGCVAADGSPDDVVRAYVERIERDGARIGERALGAAPVAPLEPTGEVEIAAVWMEGVPDPDLLEVRCGHPLEMVIELDARQPVSNPLVRVQVHRNDGLMVHGTNTWRHGLDLGPVSGPLRLSLRFDRFELLEGDYFVSVSAWPDEYRSLATGRPYAARQGRHRLRVRADRADGAGIVGLRARWERA